MDDTIRTTRVELTPAQARELAAHLILRAQRVEAAQAARGQDARPYGYTSVGLVTRDHKGAAVPVRLGFRVGAVED